MLFLTLRIVEGGGGGWGAGRGREQNGRGEALDQTEQKYHLANFPNRQREITLFSMAVLFHASISGYDCSVKGSGSY